MYASICDHCRGLPLELLLEDGFTYELFPSKAALEHSAEDGCPLCIILVNTFHRPPGPFIPVGDGPVVLKRCLSIRNGPPLSIKCGMSIGIVSCAVGSGMISGVPRKLAPTADALQNLDLIRALIADCTTSHVHCKNSNTAGFFPTRLIDIGSGDTLRSVRIVPGSQCQSHQRNYLALSHCWGKVAPGAPWKLTVSRLEEYMGAIPKDALPRTFNEAIDIAKKLGERYLWIDSLCIIQDSKKDWENEAAKMADIYSNALITLVAASAHSQGGCVVSRTPNEIAPVSITVASKACGSPNTVTIFPRLPMRSELVESAPTNQRAWCLQERELSARSLQFTSHQFLWRCKTVATSEDMILGSTWNNTSELNIEDVRSCYVYDLGKAPESSGHHQFPLRIERGQETSTRDREYYDYWYRTMEIFSSRSITEETDRLPALSGLARRQQSYVDDEYIAGLWKKDILCGLLWRQKTLFGEGGRAQRPSKYLAPSWSWISLNAPVEFEGNPFGWKVGQEFFDRIRTNPLHPSLMSASVQPSGFDPYGQVNFGHLVLQGRLRIAKRSSANTDIKGSFVTDVVDTEKGGVLGRVFFDTLAGLEAHEIVTCVCMFEFPDNSTERAGGGLALVLTGKCHGALAEYMRVGYVEWLTTPYYDEVEPTEFAII